MKTTVLSPDGPDREQRIPTQIAEWMDNNQCKNQQVKSEVALCCKAYLRTGRFSINKDRFQYTCGGQASKKLRLFLESCPFVRTVRSATKRSQTAVHAFAGIDGFRPDAQSGETLLQNQSLDIYPSPRFPLSCLSSSTNVSSKFLHKRAVKWDQWCDLKPDERTNKVDYFGRREMSRHLYDVIRRTELPTDWSFLGDLPGEPDVGHQISEREWCWQYLKYRTANAIVNKVLYVDGRIYHPLITCPRPIRRLLKIDDDLVGEADLSCSFYTLLAGCLGTGRDRNKAIDWVTSGEFYQRLQESAQSLPGIDLTIIESEQELKKQTQVQCLFHADHHPLPLRPLYLALMQEIPEMARLIQRLRRNGGASGLCRTLTRLEGQVLSPAHTGLMERELPFLPLHDGIIVRESDVELAATRVRESGIKTLGFEPLVRVK